MTVRPRRAASARTDGGHAVRGEDDRGAVGDLVELVDEDGALTLQVGDDVRVVHDLAADVDRPRVAPQGQLDDVDGPVDAGAERARSGQQHGARTGQLGPAS